MEQTEILFNGRYLRLCRRQGWEYAERVNAGAAVIIVALTPDDRLLLVEQARIPVGARSIEMPAGLVGDLHEDEGIEDAARRELLEETGWRAGRIEALMMGPSSAGMSNEQVAFVRAHDLVREGPGGGTEGEGITVHEVPREAAARWLEARRREGYSIDPKLYAGLYFIDRNPDGSRAQSEQA